VQDTHYYSAGNTLPQCRTHIITVQETHCHSAGNTLLQCRKHTATVQDTHYYSAYHCAGNILCSAGHTLLQRRKHDTMVHETRNQTWLEESPDQELICYFYSGCSASSLQSCSHIKSCSDIVQILMARRPRERSGVQFAPNKVPLVDCQTARG
jgi:hypothetical protein